METEPQNPKAPLQVLESHVNPALIAFKHRFVDPTIIAPSSDVGIRQVISSIGTTFIFSPLLQ